MLEAHNFEPKWLEAARGELGVAEIPGPEANPRIVYYDSFTTLKATSDEVAWCSSFLCFAFETTGYRSTRSAAALSWRNWGQGLSGPALGCVAVLDYGKGKGHVGLVVGVNGTNVILLGGNQGNRVSLKAIPISKIVAWRLPMGESPITDLPTLAVAPGGLGLTETR